MTVHTRRRFVALGGSSMLVAACSAVGRPEFTLKMGTNVSASHPLNVRIREAIDRIRTASGGRLEVRLFPGGQLGSDADMLSQVRAGAIELNALAGILLSTFVPVAAINGIGFAFTNSAQVFEAMDGALGALVRAEVARHGLSAFPRIFDNGFRQITTATRPVLRPADLQGIKIRVPPGQLWISMFRAFGASPTPINYSELYSALQTRVVDGQENPLAIIETSKMYEVQRYCSMTNHMWDGFWLLSNAAAMRRLPDDLRQILSREFSRAAMEQRADLATVNHHVRDTLTRAGLKFVDVDPAPFRGALRSSGFYGKWRQKLGDNAWRMLEAHAGALA